MQFYVAILIGILVAILLKINKAKMLPDFSWKSFFKLNWIPFLVNLILGFAAVYGKGSITSIFPITFVSCIVLGAGGQFIWKGLFDAVSPGVSTAIGFNE
jgi:hypothetical protein